MVFSNTLIPLIKLWSWKTNPKVDRRTRAMKVSGRLVVSCPSTRILPEVGRAMQPMIDSKVVLPDPLGPVSTVTLLAAILRSMPCRAMNSLPLPAL